MLKAGILKRAKFGADQLFEVSAEGSPAGTVNETRLAIDLGGTGYAVHREGAIAPKYELKSGETVLATATQKALFNDFTLVCGGKEWRFKAIDLLANKFGLFDGEKQIGIVSPGGFFSRLKDITIDLPEELPREVQLFLLLLAVRKWTDTGS